MDRRPPAAHGPERPREIEPTLEAQDKWVTQVASSPSGSASTTACASWYLGANVPGKTAGLHAVQRRRADVPGDVQDRRGSGIRWLRPDVAMTKTTTFRVGRDDLRTCGFTDGDLAIADGEVLLGIDRFALTANNITYAVFGDAMSYWNFFPAAEGWGNVPVWGFADVVESRFDGLEVGERIYGYLPMSTHVALLPGRLTDGLLHGRCRTPPSAPRRVPALHALRERRAVRSVTRGPPRDLLSTLLHILHGRGPALGRRLLRCEPDRDRERVEQDRARYRVPVVDQAWPPTCRRADIAGERGLLREDRVLRRRRHVRRGRVDRSLRADGVHRRRAAADCCATFTSTSPPDWPTA